MSRDASLRRGRNPSCSKTRSNSRPASAGAVRITGRRNACEHLVQIESSYCGDNSGWAGLELFSRYLRRVELSRRVGKACRGKGIRSDYGSVRLVLVLVGMLLVGARRLEHLQYVCDDPMLLRFCGLRRLPSRPTIVNWLKQFTGERLKGLSELNGVLVHEQVERLGLNRLTVDMDGTVVQAGNQVGWAFRGFNPHRKKNKSYYPLFAHLAQTGQILKSKNRPGNVHDSKGADAFLRDLGGR